MGILRRLRRNFAKRNARKERQGAFLDDAAGSDHEGMPLWVVSRRAVAIGGSDGHHHMLGIAIQTLDGLFVAERRILSARK